MIIRVKSTPENWEKEFSGKKPCTIRKLDGKDAILIERTTDGAVFKRMITDITEWNGEFIISFDPKAIE